MYVPSPEGFSVMAECSSTISLCVLKPDEAKNGGAYVTVTGSAKKVDDVSKMLLLQDGKVIPIKDIQNLSR